jgi:hypothetical protein
VAARLRSYGLEPTPERWKRQQWFHRLGQAIELIRATISVGSKFILVDDDQWGVRGVVAERQCLPFLEQNGRYWGPPADDRVAHVELARLRRAGADFLVFAWPAFWWLSHYRTWHQELRSRYDCVLRNDELCVFDLRSDLMAHPTTGVLCESR